MRLIPGTFVGIVGKKDFPFCWGCRLQEHSGCWPSLPPCAESLSESKSETEECGAERGREKERDERDRDIHFFTLFDPLDPVMPEVSFII